MKRLLITMGCSVTEGLGCYDYSKIPNISNWQELSPKDFKDQFPRFHKLGWPNRVGKKLGFDKVINLGFGGSSNSAHVKQFSENYLEKDFSDYEVLVIWMLTEPSRFSFYHNNKIAHLNSKGDSDIEKAYLNFVKSDVDYLREEIFYIKMMEQICENKGYDLVLTYWDNIIHRHTRLLYESKYWITRDYEDTDLVKIHSWKEVTEKENLKSKICDHPNELGYEMIANDIVGAIKKYWPKFVGEEREEIEWEWDGKPTDYRENLKYLIKPNLRKLI